MKVVSEKGRLIVYSWRRGRESNPRVEVLQTSALPLGYHARSVVCINQTTVRVNIILIIMCYGERAGAGDGTRTHDLLLGKETFYR